MIRFDTWICLWYYDTLLLLCCSYYPAGSDIVLHVYQWNDMQTYLKLLIVSTAKIRTHAHWSQHCPLAILLCFIAYIIPMTWLCHWMPRWKVNACQLIIVTKHQFHSADNFEGSNFQRKVRISSKCFLPKTILIKVCLNCIPMAIFSSIPLLGVLTTIMLERQHLLKIASCGNWTVLPVIRWLCFPLDYGRSVKKFHHFVLSIKTNLIWDDPNLNFPDHIQSSNLWQASLQSFSVKKKSPASCEFEIRTTGTLWP